MGGWVGNTDDDVATMADEAGVGASDDTDVTVAKGKSW